MFKPINTTAVLCRSDYEYIKNHLTRSSICDYWRIKLAHSTVVSDDLYSHHLVRIGSTVEIKDLGTGSITTFVVTAKRGNPELITSSRHPVSICSSLGFTLIGMRLGEEIIWTLPIGEEERPLRVSDVNFDKYQNEKE